MAVCSLLRWQGSMGKYSGPAVPVGPVLKEIPIGSGDWLGDSIAISEQILRLMSGKPCRCNDVDRYMAEKQADTSLNLFRCESLGEKV